MSLLIHGMPTASTVWLTFRLTSGGMRTRKSFVVNYSSSPPTLAMVMVTFFPLRPSSSLTDNLIKLTWAPESKSRFRCLLTFSDPIISTRMTGRIACLLPATDKYVKAVAEFAASAPCNNGWWKCLHWLSLNDSLHWRLRDSWKHYDHDQLALGNWNNHGSLWRPWNGRWGTLTQITDTAPSNGLTSYTTSTCGLLYLFPKKVDIWLTFRC